MKRGGAINALIDALLDPDVSRSRCRVSHEDSPEIFITEPPDRSYDGVDVKEEGKEEFLKKGGNQIFQYSKA